MIPDGQSTPIILPSSARAATLSAPIAPVLSAAEHHARDLLAASNLLLEAQNLNIVAAFKTSVLNYEPLLIRLLGQH